MKHWERFFFTALAVLFIAGLGGCAATRAIYHACKDGLCR